MRLTKFGHACVRLVESGTTVVLDPGGLTDPAAAHRADAVLITHEHFDHFEPETIRAAAAANPDLVVWAPDSVAAQMDKLMHSPGHRDNILRPEFTQMGVGIAYGRPEGKTTGPRAMTITTDFGG